jgi:hypothetical protein
MLHRSDCDDGFDRGINWSNKYDWNKHLTKEELQELNRKGYITKNQKHRK